MINKPNLCVKPLLKYKEVSMKKFSFMLLTAFCFVLPSYLFAQMTWIQATDSAGWSARSNHSSVVFDNKIWVIGGYDPTGFKRDVWFSTDGVTWTQATNSAGWSPRHKHSSVVFDNKIWVIGGYGIGSPYYKNDVWYSTDGVNWIQVTDSAGWSKRNDHSSVVFDNKIWVLGGYGSVGQPLYKRDVWFSTDGVNWNRATDSTGWLGRHSHTSVVFDNKIWVIGGYCAVSGGIYTNDVWYSTDGINWIQAADSAEWSARSEHTSVIFNNKMWVIAGQFGSTYNRDVWYSNDGTSWIQGTANAEWSPRTYHASEVFDDKMWVMGGYDTTFSNYQGDVWYATGLGIEEHSSSYTEWNAPEIFPNPANGVLRVRGPFSENNIKIFDVSGMLIKVAETVTSEQNQKQDVRISLKGIKPGIYFLRLGNENQKFLVVK